MKGERGRLLKLERRKRHPLAVLALPLALLLIPPALSGAQLCALSLYVDGMRLQPGDLDLFRTDELAGVEVYRHGLDVPFQFRQGWGDCGAVMMWSRR